MTGNLTAINSINQWPDLENTHQSNLNQQMLKYFINSQSVFIDQFKSVSDFQRPTMDEVADIVRNNQSYYNATENKIEYMALTYYYQHFN